MSAVEEVQDHVKSLHELQNARPVEARRIFRQGHYFKEVTSGLCRGRTNSNTRIVCNVCLYRIRLHMHARVNKCLPTS